MKIYNPFKEIKELQYQIECLKREKQDIQSKLDAELEPNHKTGIWCQGCSSLMEEKGRSLYYGEYNKKFCKLDIKCKDKTEACNGQ